MSGQTGLWSDTAIKVLGVRTGMLQTGDALREPELQANLLLLTGGGEGRLAMNGESRDIHAFLACHASKGSSLELIPATGDIPYTAILYKDYRMSGAPATPFRRTGHPLRETFAYESGRSLQLYQMADRIAALWLQGEGPERFHANALMQALLYELILGNRTERGGHGTDPSEAVAAYIEAHCGRALELEELAALAQLSPRQLQRRFKQAKGMGPMEYLTRVRMERAERMLRHTGATIGEIAESTGYRDAFYFSRAFKKRHGLAPQTYRRCSADVPAAYEVPYAGSVLYNQVQRPVVRHQKGEYGTSVKPARIAVLDIQYADHLIALGERPAGSVGIGSPAAGVFPPYFRPLLPDTRLLGTYEHPDLKALERLRPDLIVCTEFHAPVYESLSRIAPTLMFQRNEDWRNILRLFGDLTGKRQEAERILGDYGLKASSLSERLADRLGGQSVALIRPREPLVRVHTAAHRTGAILYRDLGLPPPPFVADVDDTACHIPVGDLPDVEAGHYFLLASGTQEDTVSVQNAAWHTLNAAERTHVYAVDAAVWIGCYGPTGINRIVDQVAHMLLA